MRGGREQGREDGSGEERRCGRGGWIDAPFGKPLVDQSPGGGGGGTRNRRLSRREQRRRKQTHEVRGIGRESARVAPPRRCGIARRARGLRGCRSCRSANANRPIACLGLSDGRAAGSPTTLAQRRWRVINEEAANARHRSRTTDGHLGRYSCAIRRYLNGKNDPPPAGEVLGAAIRPAASSRNPAAHTSRASARRPGSGIHAHGSQLARGGGRVPARCQRGAAVGHWTLASIAVSRLFPGARGLKSEGPYFKDL